MVQLKYNSRRFTVPIGSCKFKTQFVHLYKKRIDHLKPLVLEVIKETVPEEKDLILYNLTDLPKDKRCIISGILYKEAPLKRNILKDLAAEEKMENIGGVDKLKQDRFISDEDQMYLEDEVQRICLKFASLDTLNSLVTGIYTGVIGMETDADPGQFIVERLIFPGELAMKHIPSLPEMKPCLVGFVSGFCFPGQSVSMSSAHLMGLNLLGDWIRTCSTLKKLFILGNLIKITDGSANLPKFIARKNDAASLSAMKLFDNWLSDLPLGEEDGISVQILPGQNDCVSNMLPQQPFHACCLPKSVARSGKNKEALKSVTNPMLCEAEGRNILATSGQNIDDIMRYTDIKDPLVTMEATLRWGHLAPTCPDTLFGYPLSDNDPLALNSNERLDIYVSGNLSMATEPSFRRVDRKGTLMVAMPEFSRSQALVLVDISNLSCKIINFK